MTGRTENHVQNKPNRVLPGYYHLSSAGRYRSTLNFGDGSKQAKRLVGARQRRKVAKAVRRDMKARQG